MSITIGISIDGLFMAAWLLTLLGCAVAGGLWVASGKYHWLIKFIKVAAFLLLVPFTVFIVVGLISTVQGVDPATLDKGRVMTFLSIVFVLQVVGCSFLVFGLVFGCVGLLASLATEKERVADKKEALPAESVKTVEEPV